MARKKKIAETVFISACLEHNLFCIFPCEKIQTRNQKLSLTSWHSELSLLMEFALMQ